MKFDIKGISLVMVISLAMVTILSSMLSQFTDFPVLKSGGAFILLLAVVMITYLFVAAQDRKIDRGEIITIVVVAIVLIIIGVSLNKFLPEIFLAMPDATQNFFSAFT